MQSEKQKCLHTYKPHTLLFSGPQRPFSCSKENPRILYTSTVRNETIQTLIPKSRLCDLREISFLVFTSVFSPMLPTPFLGLSFNIVQLSKGNFLSCYQQIQLWQPERSQTEECRLLSGFKQFFLEGTSLWTQDISQWFIKSEHQKETTDLVTLNSWYLSYPGLPWCSYRTQSNSWIFCVKNFSPVEHHRHSDGLGLLTPALMITMGSYSKFTAPLTLLSRFKMHIMIATLGWHMQTPTPSIL